MGYPPSNRYAALRQVVDRQPYQAAIPVSLAHVELNVSGAVAAEAEEAAAALAGFDVEVGGEVAPFSAMLLRSESASSSQIEHLSASARRISEAALTTSGKPGAHNSNAELIVANVEAMDAALELSQRLDAEAILAMHRALMERSEPDVAGIWRTDQVWIGRKTPHMGDFVPPTHHRVPGAIADLVAFADRDDLPVVAQCAVAHAQFETIHPFSDGNGRTGRALIHAMLRAKGLTKQISVPLSSGLLSARDEYFAALTSFRQGDVDPIVSQMARAILLGVERGRALVADLGEVRARWRELLAGVRSHSAVHQLADLLVAQPVVTSRLVADQLGSKNPDRLLKTLAEHEIIVSASHHKSRTRLWRAPDVLDALNRFAEMSGRHY